MEPKFDSANNRYGTPDPVQAGVQVNMKSGTATGKNKHGSGGGRKRQEHAGRLGHHQHRQARREQ